MHISIAISLSLWFLEFYWCFWDKYWLFLTQKYIYFPFYLEGMASNGKKRETFFEGNSSASDLPTGAVWEMGLPGDPLLERGTKWGVVLRVGSDSGACSSPVALPVVCIKTFFFSKEWHIDWEKSATTCHQFYQFSCDCCWKPFPFCVMVENVLNRQGQGKKKLVFVPLNFFFIVLLFCDFFFCFILGFRFGFFGVFF